jgi:hypothetical protein
MFVRENRDVKAPSAVVIVACDPGTFSITFALDYFDFSSVLTWATGPLPVPPSDEIEFSLKSEPTVCSCRRS